MEVKIVGKEVGVVKSKIKEASFMATYDYGISQASKEISLIWGRNFRKETISKVTAADYWSQQADPETPIWEVHTEQVQQINKDCKNKHYSSAGVIDINQGIWQRLA